MFHNVKPIISKWMRLIRSLSLRYHVTDVSIPPDCYQGQSLEKGILIDFLQSFLISWLILSLNVKMSTAVFLRPDKHVSLLAKVRFSQRVRVRYIILSQSPKYLNGFVETFIYCSLYISLSLRAMACAIICFQNSVTWVSEISMYFTNN